jgi:LytS/YehU family sensor histidine kinase
VHVAGALLATLGWCALGVVLHEATIGGGGPYGQGVLGWWISSLPFGIAVYFAVVGVEHAARYFAEARARERQAERLSAQLADARMDALRMQLQPHFLLNSLNAIAVTIRDRDTETPTRIVELLGDMLRRVTRAGGAPEATLAEELEFVRQYLEVERVRFPDRLQPSFDVDDDVLGAAVPELVLQPLVENALRHGLARRPGAALVRVSARREGDDLVLSVTDDGPGPLPESPGTGAGIGLANIRARLATLYGARASLELARTHEGGARATVRLPWRRLT